jgi:hypothetical protein
MPITPNMSLTVPVVGTTNAPDYGLNINTCFDILDQHDHTPGNGVPVTPDGIDITTDLSMQDHNLLDVRSVRFEIQPTPIAGPSDLAALSVSGVDLYYRDASGNSIRITQGGSVVGTPGSITGLVAPATASYSTGLSSFIWQSAVNTSAAMDSGPLTVRNLVAASNGITITPPVSLPTSYTLTLPSANPITTGILRVDPSGNISNNLVTDNVTTEIVSNAIQVKDYSITAAKLAPVVTNGGSFNTTGSTTSSSFVNILSIGYTASTTTPLRPVLITIGPVQGSSAAYIQANFVFGTNRTAEIRVLRGDGAFWDMRIGSANGLPDTVYPPAMTILDESPLGVATTYTLQARIVAAGSGVSYGFLRMVATEL